MTNSKLTQSHDTENHQENCKAKIEHWEIHCSRHSSRLRWHRRLQHDWIVNSVEILPNDFTMTSWWSEVDQWEHVKDRGTVHVEATSIGCQWEDRDDDEDGWDCLKIYILTHCEVWNEFKISHQRINQTEIHKATTSLHCFDSIKFDLQFQQNAWLTWFYSPAHLLTMISLIKQLPRERNFPDKIKMNNKCVCWRLKIILHDFWCLFFFYLFDKVSLSINFLGKNRIVWICGRLTHVWLIRLIWWRIW